MKCSSILAAMVLLGASQTVSHAQTSGNPFLYTITGNFISGEPNASYTAAGGPPAVATVQVGAAATFTVKNTDTRTRHASANYSVATLLSVHTTGVTMFPLSQPTNTNSTYDSDMTSNQFVTLPGLSYLSSGSVGIGSYDAIYAFNISDNKTTDYLNQAGSTGVTVH
jgi:hypothetical protein